MDYVWLLWFVSKFPESGDTEILIGVYQSEESASAAVERLKEQPGFREEPHGFSVHRYALDQDHWTEGFVVD